MVFWLSWYIYMTQLACMFLFCRTCPCFATLRHSFLGITHPLANCLAPNPNGCCSPLSFGSLFFQYACLYGPSFFKALPCLHFMPFFQTFSCFYGFSRFSSLQFLHFPNSFLDFLGFSKLAIHVFFTIFLYFPPFPSVFNDFPSFSVVFSYLFHSAFKGPRGNRTPPLSNCLVAHAPLKESNWTP